MLEKILRLFRNVVVTLLISDVICFVWRLAEIKLYGEVQYRAVDDFIMFLIVPIIYLAVSDREKS